MGISQDAVREILLAVQNYGLQAMAYGEAETPALRALRRLRQDEAFDAVVELVLHAADPSLLPSPRTSPEIVLDDIA